MNRQDDSPRFQAHYFGHWHVIDTLPLSTDASKYLPELATRRGSKQAALYATSVLNAKAS